MAFSQQVAIGERVDAPHPPEVMARIERVCAFHEMTKTLISREAEIPAAQRPRAFRVFADQPRIALPTHLLDVPVGTLKLMTMGSGALPESLASPPQNMRTLATWLHMAAGVTGKATDEQGVRVLRSYPSAGGLYPCEIYVLALGLADLEPGLYHFSAKEFSLRQLRGGWESLSQLKRGRPDLEILKTMPAVLLVSTLMWRSAWKYGARGYRYATMDAGHLIESLCLVGTGLGVKPVVRMHVNERNTRELIGAGKEAPFCDYEPVQGFVAWGDKAAHPIQPPAQRSASAPLPPIARPASPPAMDEHREIRTVHEDCIAPGVGVLEIRPPHTETCPVGELPMAPLTGDDVSADTVLMQTLRRRRSTRKFEAHGISREQFAKMNCAAFRSISYYPVTPEGTYLGLVRPFWYVHSVTGMQPGLWYYHADQDKFSSIRHGDYRFDAKYLFADQAFCGEGAAVCILAANLKYLMNNSGPDAYRLAHLEAGIAVQRLYLACTAMGIGACAAGSFHDDELRQSLDLAGTDWQCLCGFAAGAVGQR